VPAIIELLQPDANEQIFQLANQIDNIISSYDDEFDALTELIQNSVDAVLWRDESEAPEHRAAYTPRIGVLIDCKRNVVVVSDNGCGVAPQQFRNVFRPNISLKRMVGQTSARGEKGAGVAFLQFGHRRFAFHTRTTTGTSGYDLQDGRTWFDSLSQAVESGNPPPDANFTLLPPTHPALDASSGSVAEVEFFDRSNLKSLSEISGTDRGIALRRWSYILQTRTAVGFTTFRDDRADLPPVLGRLVVTLTVKMLDESSDSTRVSVGFLYPHQMVAAAPVYLATSTSIPRGAELIYDYWDLDYIKKYSASPVFPPFVDIVNNPRFVTLFQKYKIRGYIAYSNRNTYYEDSYRALCGIPEAEWIADRDGLAHRLIQTNGGFRVAVREYPNGRLHSFIQRGGSEDKSRSFVLFDFQGPYKPDYGRKNLAQDCRQLVNETCKALIKFVRQKRASLAVPQANAPQGVANLQDARRRLAVDARALKAAGVFLDPAQAEPFVHPLRGEAQVVAEFCSLIARGVLKGYRFFGPSDITQLDGLFDFSAKRDAAFLYERDSNPLGLIMPASEPSLEYEGKWLEFKVAIDGLTEDFGKPDGTPGKKHFSTVDLAVVFDVDDDFEDYELEEIEPANAGERMFFGATHLLRKSDERNHVVQVISLKHLRACLQRMAAAS